MTTYLPIASVEQFKRALLAQRDEGLPDSHLTMLRAQCRAPNATLTATELAQAADYQNYNAANLQYGTLALNISRHLGVTLENRADGTPMCWTTLSHPTDDEAPSADSGHFQFVMRPELVTALREMRWA